MTCLKRFLFCSIALASGILSVSLAHAGDARTADDEAIQVWVGTYEDHQEEGIAYGCGAFLLPVDTEIARSGSPYIDLRVALEALFNPELDHPSAETEGWLKGLGLTVQEISLVEGAADIRLGGELTGIGSCGDAIMEGQLLRTVFQFDFIERVKISDGVSNLWQIVDQRDRLSEQELKSYIYERETLDWLRN